MVNIFVDCCSVICYITENNSVNLLPTAHARANRCLWICSSRTVALALQLCSWTLLKSCICKLQVARPRRQLVSANAKEFFFFLSQSITICLIPPLWSAKEVLCVSMCVCVCPNKGVSVWEVFTWLQAVTQNHLIVLRETMWHATECRITIIIYFKSLEGETGEVSRREREWNWLSRWKSKKYKDLFHDSLAEHVSHLCWYLSCRAGAFSHMTEAQ